MDPATLGGVLVAAGAGAYVPLVLAVVGLFSVISTVYKPTWPGAAVVHVLAGLIGHATPAVPAGRPPPSVAGAAVAVIALWFGVVLLAACSPAQVAAAKTAYAKDLPAGQLFCERVQAIGPVIVAVADSAGVPILATGAATEVVQRTCAAVGALPVAPPADLAQAVPVVAAVATAAVTPGP